MRTEKVVSKNVNELNVGRVASQVCKQVDGIEHVYSREELRAMYEFLSENGECYYISIREGGPTNSGFWRLIGDVSLWDGRMAVVICREFQNRHLGRQVIAALVARAKEIGWKEVGAEVYAFNGQSRRAFEAAGFERRGEEWYVRRT